ncbi:MAG: hypothetical protein IPM45_13030 [Acidimicrobiales bacterium]|nr:hypothetical protein [Acidimicrobiales bacterium]
MPAARVTPAPSPRLLLTSLRRRPLLAWGVTLTLAGLTAAVVGGLTARAGATLDRYGTTRTVVVAAAALPAGHRVGPGDVTRRDVPVAFVPDGALAEAPLGRRLRDPVAPGEVLVPGRLAPDGVGPLAAQLPADQLGLAVPVDAPGLRLGPGDVVDVLATFDPTAAGEGDPTVTVASGATVLDTREGSVTLAVDAADAPRVAFALAAGVVTLALRGGGPG